MPTDYKAILMNKTVADEYVEATKDRDHQFGPVMIRGGEHYGKYIVPYRVFYDPYFSEFYESLRLLPVVILDTDIAFPPPDDDEE